jgi:hypothetical protein
MVRAIIWAIMVLFAAFCAAAWRPREVSILVEPVAPFAVARVWIRQADSRALGAHGEDRDQHRHDSEPPHSGTNGDNQKLLRTYKDWAFRNKKKAEAGMKHSTVTPFSPAKGAAAGSDYCCLL